MPIHRHLFSNEIDAMVYFLENFRILFSINRMRQLSIFATETVMRSEHVFFYVSQVVNLTGKQDSHMNSNTIAQINGNQKTSDSFPLNNFHRKIDRNKKNAYDRIDFSTSRLSHTFIVGIWHIK